MSRGLTLSDIYAGELVDANELAGTTRIVVTSAWGLLAPAKLTDIATWLGANGLILSSLIDQPNGVAGLDANGQIVGPIILSVYANAAAAGVLANGTLAKVGDGLRLGDGSTTGGNAIANPSDFHSTIGSDSTIALDPNASSAFIYVAANNPGTVTVSNYASLPLGYEIVFYTYDAGIEFTLALSLNGTVASHVETQRKSTTIRKIANTGTAATDYVITNVWVAS